MNQDPSYLLYLSANFAASAWGHHFAQVCMAKIVKDSLRVGQWLSAANQSRLSLRHGL